MIRFKTSKIEHEWAGESIDPKLRKIIQLVDAFCGIEAPGYAGITLTSIMRTEEEERKIYDDPEHKPGVHVFGRGADIRTEDMPADLALRVSKFLKQITYRKGSKHTTAVYGDERHQDHIHVQVSY